MWQTIQFDPKQVSMSLRNKCNFENQLYLYDKAVFQEVEDARHAYGSLKTEGSKLTFDQTSMLMKGEVPRSNADNKDILEAISLSAALKELRFLVDNKVPFTEEIVKRIHKTYANGHLSISNCGEYRTKPNFIGDGNYLTAAPNQINKLMKRLFEVLEKEENPIIKAALFGFNYIAIHPFIDFNGRTSRLFECYIFGIIRASVYFIKGRPNRRLYWFDETRNFGRQNIL